jgi:hypothetical protein
MPLLSRTLCVLAITVSLWSASAPPCRADDKAPAPASTATLEPAQPSDNPEYDRLLKEALGEFKLGNWTEARALFERAHELKPSARTLRAIGLSAFEEKSYAEAAAYLTAALTDQRRPLTDDQRTEAEYALKRSLGYVAQYDLEILPEGAEVLVDSRKPIMLDGKLLLDPGKYQLEVTADGYQLTRESIVARPRENLTLRIELSPRGSDGTTAPQAAGGDDDGLTTQQWIGIGVGAAGIVSLGVGAYFGLTAMSKADDAGCENGLCSDPASEKLNEEALDAGNVATVALIAGTVLAGAGVVLFFVPFGGEEKPQAQALRVQPVLSTQHAGVQLGGAF